MLAFARSGGIAVALAFVAPVVGASGAALDVHLVGPLVAPAAASADFGLIAAFLADARALDVLELDAARLRVHRENETYAATPARGPLAQARVQLTDRPESYALEGARVTLAAGDAAGWLAIVGSEGLRARFVSSGDLVIEALDESRIGATDARNENVPEAERHGFAHAQSGPHVRIDAAGALEVRGSGALKLMGPDVVIHAAGETRHEPSGRWREDELARRQERDVTLWLEFSDATLRLRASALAEIVAPDAALAWDGAARATAHEGTIRNDYETTLRGPVELRGRVAATLEPESVAGRVVARLQSDAPGEVVLAGVPLAKPAGAAGAPFLLIALGAVLATTGASAVLRARRPRIDVLQLLHDRFPPVEAHYEIARLLAALDQERDAADWLLRALDADPARALDASIDPVLRALADREPRVAAALGAHLRARGLI